jgi:radical SAM superfamily enzyme YgiQ (UPF0313 family)
LPTKKNTPNILLVNPWIHDFAAYDFWAKPLGLLTLGSILSAHGYNISYIDCLDRFHPNVPTKNKVLRNGRGPYMKTTIPMPHGLEDIPRRFSRYGILPEWFKCNLLSVPAPDLILVTSAMTYWASGVKETIAAIKEIFPDTPLVLGGIYATLCKEHAQKYSGADIVFTGRGEPVILKLVGDYTGYNVSCKFDPDDLDTYPYPALNLQNKIAYVPVMTSRGCPFSCAYCASHILDKFRMERNPDSVVQEILYWHKKFSIADFAFYDDALLVNASEHAIPILEAIIKSGITVNFHTPNALHIREISKQIAGLMFKAGFKTIRLGLETGDFENRRQLDAKVGADDFKHAISNLKQAGFKSGNIGAYLLAGLPGQTGKSIIASINMVKQNRITPILAYYTPIPKTALWDKAVASSRYNLELDPVFTNNAILPCQKEPFSWEYISYLKNS